jgi:hypothetical protein
MTFRRVVLGCLLVVASGYPWTSATSGSRVPTLRDAWFTTTVTMPGQRYRATEPERIWARVEQFVRGKDEKVIMIVVFNDPGSHHIGGHRVDPRGKEHPFEWSVTPLTGGTSGWRATSKTWEVDKLTPGQHTVELVVDSAPAGRYAFEVK